MICTNCKKKFEGLTCSCGYCPDCIKLKHPNGKFKAVKKSFKKMLGEKRK